MEVDLSKFSIGDYNHGRKWKLVTWFFVNYIIFNSFLPWPSSFKRRVLVIFGGKIGRGIVIKNKIRIKYPWRLSIGKNCWIGEDVWIDNLESVEIGNNVCISQGAMLLTGNHDYTISSFPYRLGKIKIEDGVWIGAKSVVCPGITCRSHAILTVNSVATSELMPFGIYSGNPARMIRTRKMSMKEGS